MGIVDEVCGRKVTLLQTYGPSACKSHLNT